MKLGVCTGVPEVGEQMPLRLGRTVEHIGDWTSIAPLRWVRDAAIGTDDHGGKLWVANFPTRRP
jgi:hypothetical protein